MLSCCSIAFCFLPNERKTTPPNYVYRPPNARPIHLSVGGNSCPTRSHRMRRLRKPPTHLCGPFCVNLSRPHNIQRHRSSALPPTAVCCKRPVCSSFGMFVLLSMSVLRFKVRVQPPSATCGPLVAMLTEHPTNCQFIIFYLFFNSYKSSVQLFCSQTSCSYSHCIIKYIFTLF